MKKRIVVASLLAAGLLFSGCTTHPGAVAVYQGETLVTEASVETVAQSLNPELQVPRAALAYNLAVANLLKDDIKAENTTSPQTFEEDGTAQCKSLGVNYKKANEETKRLCNLFSMAAGSADMGTGNEKFQQAMTAALQALSADVTFSPRYAVITTQNPYPSYIIGSNVLATQAQKAAEPAGQIPSGPTSAY